MKDILKNEEGLLRGKMNMNLIIFAIVFVYGLPIVVTMIDKLYQKIIEG